ncbi:MAG: sigma-70 family RNA polymerase sigma factor [Myxococcota bacterium]
MDVDPRASSSAPSFRSMYREHYGLVWGTARRFGVDDHLLDDAVQEAFLVAYRRMDSFEGPSPKAWLYGITRRVASNVRRSELRSRRRKDAVRQTMQASTPRPADAVEAWQSLDRFLAGLGERQREIFVLSELEGMTGAEVARSLGLRPSTTYDAIRALRRRFASNVENPPPRSTLRRMAQREQPRASARSWALLVAAMPSSKLGLGKVAAASSKLSWAAMPVGGKATLVGLGLAAAVAVGVAVSDDAPAPAPTRSAKATAVKASPSASASDSSPARAPDEAAPAEPTNAEDTDPATAPAPPTPAAPPPVAKPTMDAPAAPRSLAAENALLRDAAQALAEGNPAQALALSDRHAKEHAGSPMRDISTAMRIESLCALGKQAQARGEAAMFLRRRPKSPMAARVRDACPEKSSTTP